MTEFAYFCGHEQFHPEELVEHAQLAEQAGFDWLVVSEHFHPWVDDVSASGYAFATIAAMATVTERVQIAAGVTTPLFRYHPGVIAQASAMLDTNASSVRDRCRKSARFRVLGCSSPDRRACSG